MICAGGGFARLRKGSPQQCICQSRGGGIAGQGEILLEPLRKMVKENCFGGAYGEIPDIEIARLGNRAGMIGAANLL